MARATPKPTRLDPDGPRPRRIVVVLGDQLSPSIAALAASDPQRDIVLMAEVEGETTYVRHHKKKLILVLSAMRHFAGALREAGWHVIYRTLDETGPGATLTSEVQRATRLLSPERVTATLPGEWRVLEAMRSWERALGVPVELLEDDRFVCTRAEFGDWAAGRKQLRMELFYREMRRKTGLLMDGDVPVGGRWNLDQENRKRAKGDLLMPRPLRFPPDAITTAVAELVETAHPNHFGDSAPFWFGVTRDHAEAALAAFLREALPSFGDYQDAMLDGEPFLFHSLLSIYMNIGLLDPMAVCRAVETEYRAGRAPINAAEGYIRQIIGWREYVRGIYWLRMPGYERENVFGHTRPVPDFYWTADTKMACLKAAVGQTLREAYAHHIQRLMITGNFALLAGVSPEALHEWYLGVYADAYEWVELPNTVGMSQFADGGLLASKPYAASGAYINRMSDYCRDCAYKVKEAVGERACPFNSLYWSFLARNRALLGGNPRMVNMYGTWDRMPEERRTALLAQAQATLARLDGDAPDGEAL